MYIFCFFIIIIIVCYVFNMLTLQYKRKHINKYDFMYFMYILFYKLCYIFGHNKDIKEILIVDTVHCFRLFSQITILLDMNVDLD